MRFPALSQNHVRFFFEKNVGPISKVVELLKDEKEKLAEFRERFSKIIATYFEDNSVKQDFLLN